MTDLSAFSTIAEITAGIRSKEISPVEHVESHLRRVPRAPAQCLRPFGCRCCPRSGSCRRSRRRACAERDLLREKILRQMDRVPILLSPVSSAPAFRHGEGNYKPGAGYRDTMRFSQWINLTGFPGASVPVSLSNEGLPIGVQIIGRPFEDELVLAVAEALEHSQGPWQPAPLQNTLRA